MKVLIITTPFTGFAVRIPDEHSCKEDTDRWLQGLFEDGVPFNEPTLAMKVFEVIDLDTLEARIPQWFERKRRRREEDR